MDFFMPRRYLTLTDQEPDAGFFSIGHIVDSDGATVYGAQYADVIAGVREKRINFDIYVSGKSAPIDELRDRYLLASPIAARSFRTKFGRQLEFLPTKAVDDETGKSYAMVLLRPLHEIACFIRTRKVRSTKDGGDLTDHIGYTRSGTPQTYCLSRPAIGSLDITLITNSPEPVLAVSERFRDAITNAIPRAVRHLPHLEFRRFCLLDESPRLNMPKLGVTRVKRKAPHAKRGK